MATASSLTFRDIIQRINCEPLTRKELLSSHPRLFCIYTNEAGLEPLFEAAEKKTRGTALGTFYDMVARLSFLPSRWLGKVGLPTGHLRNDPLSIRSHTEKNINLDTILEMLAYSFYQEFGRNLFIVPNTFLSNQPIINRFTADHALAVEWALQGITKSLRIMCELVPGYLDFSKATTSDSGQSIPFIEFIQNNHRPPTNILSPSGTSVPLLGIIELLAVMRALADTDGLGGKGENAGFIWVKEGETIIAARAVKIDPGCAFRFAVEEEGEPCENRVINTHYNLGNPRYHLQNECNIQVANHNDSVDIHWNSLSQDQQEIFLSTLMNCLRYRNNKNVLDLLFYREGKFNKSPLEQIPEATSETLIQQMCSWLELQEKIYVKDLKAFYIAHPEQLLRIQYIDTYGQLPLPTSDETFPIRELFTELVLMDQSENEEQPIERDPEMPESDSLRDAFKRLQYVKETVTLEGLLEAAGTRPTPRKILLLGRAGIGKSTLCQKIAHDWASGKLWNDRYTAIYCLSLRQCNHFLEEEPDPRRWLSQALALLVLKQEFLKDPIEVQLKNHPQQVFIILDGYDEATPDVADRIQELLHLPELNLAITSRPGHTDHLHSDVDRVVENMGFSDDQIESYINKFLQRGQRSAAYATSQKNALVSALKADPNLFSLAHIPLQLQMLCSLWEKGASAKGFPSTLTALYRTMVEEIFRWQCRREKRDPDDVTRRERVILYNCLGDLALRGLSSGKLLIPDEILQQALDRFEISHKKLLASGLLKAVGEGALREYHFIHLSYQEYMIALSAAQKSPQEREQFILTYRYHPQFQLVFGFLAGIINQQDTSLDKKEVKQLIETLHATKTGLNGELFGADLVGTYQLELTLRCLSECDLQVQQWAGEKYHIYEVLTDLIVQGERRQIRNRAISWCKLNKIPADVMSSIIHQLAAKIYNLSEILEPHTLESLVSLSQGTSQERWEEIWAVIKQALKDENKSVRQSAVHSLKLLIEGSPSEKWEEIFGSLKDALKDKSNDVRIKAADGLGSLGEKAPPERWKKVWEALKEELKNEAWDVQKAAIESSLKSLNEKAPLERWRELLAVFKDASKSENNNFQRMGKCGLNLSLRSDVPLERWRESLAVLKELLEDGRDSVQKSGVECLKYMNREFPLARWAEIWAVIKEALKKENAAGQEAAKAFSNSLTGNLMFWGNSSCYGDMGDMWVVIIEALKNVNTEVREAVAQFDPLRTQVSSEKWEEVFSALNKALKDQIVEVRRLAARLLGSLGQEVSSERWERVLAAAKIALGDEDENVSHDVLYTFERLRHEVSSEKWTEVLKTLNEEAEKKENTRAHELYGIRVFASMAKNALKSWEQVFAELKAALLDGNNNLREVSTSLRFLAEKVPIGNWGELFTVIKEVLQDENFQVQNSALSSLAILGKKAPSDRFEEVLTTLINRWEKVQTILTKAKKDISHYYSPEVDFLVRKKHESIKQDLEWALVSLGEGAPPEMWQKFWETINETSNTNNIQNRFFTFLSEEAPSEKWREVLALFKEILKYKNGNVRIDAISPFGSFATKIPLESLEEVLSVLKETLNDKDKKVQKKTLTTLIHLGKKAPLERWKEVLLVLAAQIQDRIHPKNLDSARKVLKKLIKQTHLEKWNGLFIMESWSHSLAKVFIDVLMKQQKPLCLLRADPSQSLELCFGHNWENARPFTQEVMQLVRRAVAEGPFSKYVASYMQ